MEALGLVELEKTERGTLVRITREGERAVG